MAASCSAETQGRRDAILEAVRFAAEEFLWNQDWEKSILEVLRQLGEAARVSRVYIFQNSYRKDGVMVSSRRYEWCAPGIRPQIDDLAYQNFALSEQGFRRWVEALSLGHPIYGQVSDMPSMEQTVLRAQDICSLIVVPVTVNAEWWGFIGFDECSRERSWAPLEIDALRAAASTLSAAIQRLLEEQASKRRANVISTLLEISEMIGSTLDVSQVLDRVVIAASRLLGIDRATVFLWDEQAQVLRSTVLEHGGEVVLALTPEQTGELANLEFSPKQFPVVDVLRQKKEPIQVVKTHNNPFFPPELLERFGARSLLIVPLILQNQFIGCLYLDHIRQTHVYSREEIELAGALARQVTLAIDRAKLFQGEQMRRHEAEILREASAALNSSLELDKVLDNLLVYLGMVLPYDSACIFLHQNGSLRAVAGQGFPNLSAIIGKVFPGDNQLMQESIRLRAPLVLRNAQDDPRFSRWGGTNYVKAWMGVPLFGRGEMIGYMTLDSRQEGVFGQEQSALAMAFANTATAAIHNAQLHTEVQHLAMTDPLTGLYNLRALQEFGRREVERARRFNRPLSAILIDVDHFKIINDTYGHLIGNQVLSGLAKCCDENVRDVDIFARYGGEEFVLLLPETELEDARLVAERLRVLVAGTPLPTDGGPLSITISLGVSAGRGSTGNGKLKDIKELLEQADAALYIAKQSGRNRVSVNPESQHENGSRPAARQK